MTVGYLSTLEACVSHLLRTHSDHCSLQIKLQENYVNTTNKVFRFESMWISYPSFPNIITEAFPPNSPLIQLTQTFNNIVTQWNRHTFGNIFQKKRILAKLAGIHKSPSYQFSDFLLNLEGRLIKELDSILKKEEDFWKLKSRVS